MRSVKLYKGITVLFFFACSENCSPIAGADVKIRFIPWRKCLFNERAASYECCQFKDNKKVNLREQLTNNVSSILRGQISKFHVISWGHFINRAKIGWCVWPKTRVPENSRDWKCLMSLRASFIHSALRPFVIVFKWRNDFWLALCLSGFLCFLSIRSARLQDRLSHFVWLITCIEKFAGSVVHEQLSTRRRKDTCKFLRVSTGLPRRGQRGRRMRRNYKCETF